MKQIKKTTKPSDKRIDTNALIKMKHWLGVIIAVFAFILYAQSITFNYALDDTAVLKKNNSVHKGIGGIPEIIKKSYWYGMTGIDDPIYRPASLVLFAIEWQFFPDNTKVFHFVNVFCYALSCWLLFLLLCKLFKNQNLLFPFVCGLLYTAHPIHTEVVDNIKSMDEILCFIFAIGSVLFFIKWLSNNSIPTLILAIVSLFLSMLSKETGIVFLLIIPLTLYVFVVKDTKKLLTASVVVAAVTGLYVIMRYKILINTATEGHLSIMDNSLMGADGSLSYFASAMFILLRYIFLLIVPHPLSYDYSFSQIPLKNIGDPMALFAILIYLSIFVFAAIKIRSRNVAAYAAFFFLITLFPVSNIYLKLASTMAERFLYIPSLGFCLILTYCLLKITKSEAVKTKFINIRQMVMMNGLLFTFVMVIVGLYSIKVMARNPDWKDNASLFVHDAETADNSARVHYNYGTILIDNKYPAEQNAALKAGILEHAITEFNKAIAIYPNYPEVYSYLAVCFIKKEDFATALKYQEQYVQRHTSPDPSIHKNLAVLYKNLKQYEQALVEFEAAIKEDPGFLPLYVSKGEVYGQMNRYEESNNEFFRAMKVDPKSVTPYVDIGVNYASQNQFEKAMEFFKQAEVINPNDKENAYLMGVTYEKLGDAAKSKQYLERAERLAPEKKD